MKNISFKSLYIILLIAMIPVQGFSQTKESVYNELVNIYKHVTTVSFHFKMAEENLEGTLTAQEGNKYKMVLQDHIIICNGKTVWNYSPKENKVVISNFEKVGDDISLEIMFFSFLENFEPVKIKEANTSSGVSAFVLTLKRKAKAKGFKTLSTVEIWVNKGTYDIIQFHVTEPQKMTWYIDKLKLRKKSEDKIFEFEPQKDCKIIDLR